MSAASRQRLKRLLLAAVIAASAPGCASPRGVWSVAETAPTPPPQASSAEDVTLPDAAEQEPSRLASSATEVQPVTYTDAAEITAPAAFAQQRNDPIDRSFGQLLELDAPRGQAEGQQEEGQQEGGRGGERGHEGDRVEGAGGQIETGYAGLSDAQISSLRVSVSPPLPAPDAQLPARQPVDFFVQQALAVHPSIRAARQRVAAELDRIPQVTALPDPQFTNTFWPFPDNNRGGIASHMSFQQGVPFPAKLRTQGAIVSREAQIAQAEVESIERQVTESVRLAYYEVWYATRAVQVVEEMRGLVEDLTKVAESRYRAGGTQQDVIRAQLETDRLDNQLVQLRQLKEMSQADLAALLQQPTSLIPEATEELGIADAPLQLDALIAQAEQCNPNLRGLAAEIQRDRQNQRLAGLQNYPDFVVGLNWGIARDQHDVFNPTNDGNDDLSFTIGATLPIWREKINAGIREANRRTSSTAQRLEAERSEIHGRLRRLLAQADSLVDQTSIYRDRLVPRTEDTLKLAIADYRGKRTDFFSLIGTYRELLTFEIQLARIHATLAGTIAQVDRTVGCAN